MFNYFSKGEKLLWGGSVTLILAAFFVFDRANYLNLAASLVGVTSLIFAAKANPVGQVLERVHINAQCPSFGEFFRITSLKILEVHKVHLRIFASFCEKFASKSGRFGLCEHALIGKAIFFPPHAFAKENRSIF